MREGNYHFYIIKHYIADAAKYDILIILLSFEGDDYAYIVCVGYEPRIQYCGDGTVFDPQILTCVYAGPPQGVPSGPGFGPF